MGGKESKSSGAASGGEKSKVAKPTKSSGKQRSPSGSLSGSSSGGIFDMFTADTFGAGVQVGRTGNVDLSGRDMDVLDPHLIQLIISDGLHRTATSLTLTNNRLYSLGRELSALRNLKELEIDNNRFQRIPEVLVQLTRLTKLKANGNRLETARSLEVCPRILQLRSLCIRNCGLKEIPNPILQCELLVELDVGDNTEIKLTNAQLFRLAKLTKLGVANCGLTGRTLPLSIKKMRLVSLDISGNSFTFADSGFFGKLLPRTLNELNLSSMELAAVPAVVALLRKLHTLDLSRNPIETLDVLAGRVVKRLPRVDSNVSGATGATGALSDLPEEEEEAFLEEDKDGAASVNSDAASSKVSISKVSKAGAIPHVTQPIPLRKLSLRACGFRAVPKYFHKLINLEELDLSENENLDDPNMTLFSLQKLVALNITGCPFALDPSRSRNEWFDIAKLHYLQTIQWEIWKSDHNMNPYRTRIPLELCGLALDSLNEIKLRRHLFAGETLETVVNLLSDGYFKVDLSVDDLILKSHMHAVKAFGSGEAFFFPRKVAAGANISGASLGTVHAKIVVSRYIFFLAMQAANYDAVIIPPLDVMMMHYAQLTVNPRQYREDCEAICGRLLNCNYRTFFAEQRQHLAEAKEAVTVSKRIWNLMVKSAQRELAWLRYDYWDKRGKESVSTAAGEAGKAETATAASHTAIATSLPLLMGSTKEEVARDWQSLVVIDSEHDLTGVLDQAITSHFAERGTDCFVKALRTFFNINNCFTKHEGALRDLDLDWTRYVKYLTLYAYRQAILVNGNTTVMEPTMDKDGNLYNPAVPGAKNGAGGSYLGKRYDTMGNTSFADPTKYLPKPGARGPTGGEKMPSRSGSAMNLDEEGAPQRSPSAIVRRNNSSLLHTKRATQRINSLKALEANPPPTIGICLLLHAHRTSHVKYFQALSLFGIESIDVTWDANPVKATMTQTQTAWKALYDEAYVNENASLPFAYKLSDGILVPVASAGTESSAESGKHRYTYSGAAKAEKGVLRKRSTGEKKATGVTFCGADTEFGVF